MIALSERQQIVSWIEEAHATVARRNRACVLLGITLRTLQRWRQSGEVSEDGRCTRTMLPANKLSDQERQTVLSVANSAEIVRDIVQRKGIIRQQVTLHSDNGGPMKGTTMLATLKAMGILPSFSRPAVSNDNPYSEALFKTLKYRPDYPVCPFTDLKQARRWVAGFVDWYNHDHRHSAVQFVTPHQRHTGQDITILKQRKAVYEAAKQQRPERWRGQTRNWEPVHVVYLNPTRRTKK